MLRTEAQRRGCLALAASLLFAAAAAAQPPVYYNGPQPPQQYPAAPMGYGQPMYYYPPQGGYPYGPPQGHYAQQTQYPGTPTAPPAAYYPPSYQPQGVEVDAPVTTLPDPRPRPAAARFEMDTLLWWMRGSPISSPILTQGPFASAAQGQTIPPGNTVVYGNESREFGVAPGFRLKLEAWEPHGRDVGMSVSGFILGQQINRATITSNGQDAANALSFAFNPVQPLGAGSTANLLAGPVVPGVTAAGEFTAITRARLWGADFNLLYNAYRCDYLLIDMMVGFRYLDLGESLEMTSRRVDSDLLFERRSSESFGTRNQFYGGQLGTRAECFSGPLTFSILGTLAVGANLQDIAIDGTSTRSGTAAGTVGTVSGFIFTQPSNIGKFSRTDFSVVPSIQLRTGYRLTERMFASFGYEFTYWSNVVRPGDQIDNTVNLSQSTAVPGTGVLVGDARPGVPFRTADFWVQGLILGLELRY